MSYWSSLKDLHRVGEGHSDQTLKAERGREDAQRKRFLIVLSDGLTLLCPLIFYTAAFFEFPRAKRQRGFFLLSTLRFPGIHFRRSDVISGLYTPDCEQLSLPFSVGDGEDWKFKNLGKKWKKGFSIFLFPTWTTPLDLVPNSLCMWNWNKTRSKGVVQTTGLTWNWHIYTESSELTWVHDKLEETVSQAMLVPRRIIFAFDMKPWNTIPRDVFLPLYSTWWNIHIHLVTWYVIVDSYGRRRFLIKVKSRGKATFSGGERKSHFLLFIPGQETASKEDA